MKNRIIVNVKGKRIDNFLNKLVRNKIELHNIRHISDKEIIITISEHDYDFLLNHKSIYEIQVVGYRGLPKIKHFLKKNSIFLVAILFGFSILLFLTNIIFEVEVIYNEESIRNLITTELRLYDIEKYKFVKPFKEIEKVKKQILEKYKDKIEWLEISRIGTKYEVRLELRKLPQKDIDDKMYHIVAKKDAIIKKIEVTHGEKIKNINDYVKKGDIVISSNITLNENIKGTVSAKGSIYGEVWYQVDVEYPFVYKEEIVTGKNKTTYGIQFLNKTYNLFDFKPYQNKRVTTNTIFGNLFLPLSFVKQKEEEIRIVDEINTEEEATAKALDLAKKRVEEDLTDKEYIISSKVLSSEIKDSKIVCVVFFTVYEDITDYKEVEETG